jgi:hypothetical protein
VESIRGSISARTFERPRRSPQRRHTSVRQPTLTISSLFSTLPCVGVTPIHSLTESNKAVASPLLIVHGVAGSGYQPYRICLEAGHALNISWNELPRKKKGTPPPGWSNRASRKRPNNRNTDCWYRVKYISGRLLEIANILELECGSSICWMNRAR